ncbi:helix-turn-helix transcriptional regulator [Mycobacterium sp. Marseille-P9652]|uniref:helix-turn-helix transcriptional regulator n=1 Tax=Mycobacterium sp. Marseille-P9652 TaxID=2654950 RepID=UPI0012E8D92B
MTQTDRLLGVREVAGLLGVSPGTVYSMRYRGTGPAGWRRGKRLVFRRSDVENFLIRECERTLKGEGG